jgi:hypothetical protein
MIGSSTQATNTVLRPVWDRATAEEVLRNG